MEKLPNSQDFILASNRLFGKDRFYERQKAEHEANKWKQFEAGEAPFKKIIYDRKGILADDTKLNIGVADEFMRRSDMRRDIMITDSYRRPLSERQLSMDSLAKTIQKSKDSVVPLYVKESATHAVSISPDQVTVQIHDQMIDQKVREKQYFTHKTYQIFFINELNKAVKNGISQALQFEKFNLRDFGMQYFYWTIVTGTASLYENNPALIVPTFVAINIVLNCAIKLAYEGSDKPHDTIIPAYVRRPLKELLLPAVPIDKYVKGQYILERYGKNLILPKS